MLFREIFEIIRLHFEKMDTFYESKFFFIKKGLKLFIIARKIVYIPDKMLREILGFFK